MMVRNGGRAIFLWFFSSSILGIKEPFYIEDLTWKA